MDKKENVKAADEVNQAQVPPQTENLQVSADTGNVSEHLVQIYMYSKLESNRPCSENWEY